MINLRFRNINPKLMKRFVETAFIFVLLALIIKSTQTIIRNLSEIQVRLSFIFSLFSQHHDSHRDRSRDKEKERREPKPAPTILPPPSMSAKVQTETVKPPPSVEVEYKKAYAPTWEERLASCLFMQKSKISPRPLVSLGKTSSKVAMTADEILYDLNSDSEVPKTMLEVPVVKVRHGLYEQ